MQSAVNLGVMYYHGQGVAQDYSAAMKWYRMAADQGNAQFAVQSRRSCTTNGRGVAQDYSAAMKWYRMAADQGLAQVQCNLGFMYHQGLGVAPGLFSGDEVVRMAADQGHAEAQCGLGNMYNQGRGIPQNASRSTAMAS